MLNSSAPPLPNPNLPQLTLPPASEPLTLLEVKEWLRLDVEAIDEDNLLNSLIVTARMMLEAASSHAMLAQNWKLTLPEWPQSGLIPLGLKPLISLNEIRIYEEGGNHYALPPRDYIFDANRRNAEVCLLVQRPAMLKKRSPIEISLTLGFGANASDVPQPLRLAMLMLIARLYNNRGECSCAAGDKPLPEEVRALISGFLSGRGFAPSSLSRNLRLI